jgi:hypothetical protein
MPHLVFPSLHPFHSLIIEIRKGLIHISRDFIAFPFKNTFVCKNDEVKKKQIFKIGRMNELLALFELCPR